MKLEIGYAILAKLVLWLGASRWAIRLLANGASGLFEPNIAECIR